MSSFVSARIHRLLGRIFLLVLFIASVVPENLSGAPAIPHFDKLLHGAAYGFAALWFSRVTEVALFPSLGAKLFSFGLFIEALQYFLPYRSASIADLVANGFGIAAALIVAQHSATGFRSSRRGQ